MSFFWAYQDTAVGSSELTIHTIVLPSISAESYRKTMIAILFLRRIHSLSSSPSISISDLTATVAAYFAIPSGSTEREAKRIVDSVCNDFFHVDNLQGVGCLDSSGRVTVISDLTNSRSGHYVLLVLFHCYGEHNWSALSFDNGITWIFVEASAECYFHCVGSCPNFNF